MSGKNQDNSSLAGSNHTNNVDFCAPFFVFSVLSCYHVSLFEMLLICDLHSLYKKKKEKESNPAEVLFGLCALRDSFLPSKAGIFKECQGGTRRMVSFHKAEISKHLSRQTRGL